MMATMAAAQVNRIRDYEQADAPAIARLFYDTVHSVNRADYSEEQVEAWAPAIPDVGEWHDRMYRRRTLVAEEGGKVVGFCELEEDGHLDMFYVRKDAVGRGIGRSLYEAAERGRRGGTSGASLPRRASRPAPSSSGGASAS